MPAVVTFRDQARLTSWLTLLLYSHAAISAGSILSDWMQLQLLASAPFSAEDADANDARQRIVSIVYFLSFLATVVACAIWVYRANTNARALGAQGLRFTPAWAVGWYFIPIASLWKPYQAMVEIWRASKAPAAWQTEALPPALSGWWLFWVTTCIVGQLSFRMTLGAQSLHDFTAATWVNIVASGVSIPSAVLLARLVQEIWRMQRSHAARRATAAQAEAPAG